MRLAAAQLRRLVSATFYGAGCGAAEADRVAQCLVEANLVGHDSHGVIRVRDYVAWLRDGLVVANQVADVVFENDVLAVLDGRFGFGQVLGEQAMSLALDKAGRQKVAIVALRNAGHLGRIGDWAEMAASRQFVSLHFVNTSGGGILVAPHGGIERRLSANPIAVGIPRLVGPPLVLDMSTCTIAEGKIKVARNRGDQVPPGAIIDADGNPTTDPAVFYGPPPGAILPLAGHKGFGLSVVTEMLAGALAGGSCSRPGERRVANNMLSIVIDPNYAGGAAIFASEIERFVEFVKSARTVAPGGEILMPGELEVLHRQARLAQGIELDDATWQQLCDTARSVDVDPTAHTA